MFINVTGAAADDGYKYINWSSLALNRASAGIYACTVLYCTVLYCTVLYCTVHSLHFPQIPIPILTPNTKVQIPNTKVQNSKYARLITNLL